MQLAATLLLFPFIKNIFRFNNERFSRLSKNYSTSGIFLAAIKVMILFAVIHNVYHFYFSWQMYLLAYLYTLAFYFYYTQMIDFTRNHRQYTAVFITLICSMANVIFTVLLTPVLRLEGALLSGTMVQWLMVALLTYSSGKTFRLEKLFHG